MSMQIPSDARPRLSHGVRLQIDRTTGKGVLLFPEGIFELNDTAQEILSRCDGRTVSRIAAELAQEYDTDLATIDQDVCETLVDLQQRRLLELS